MHKTFLGLIAIALAGCASPGGGLTTASAPAPKTIQEPYPTEWRHKVAAFVKANWKDPASIRDAELAAPVVEIIPANLNIAFAPRWVVCVSLNAKNSFGGYTGKTMHQVLMRDNRVLAVQPASQMGPTCDNAKLEPFSEINGSGA